MKFRKKSVVIEAVQWFKNGDHPKDGKEVFIAGEFKGQLFEGKIVRYYRTPSMDGQTPCKHCGVIMHYHGWIDTLEGGHIVCPKDWIITGVKGEFYPCKPDIFEMTYASAQTPSPDPQTQIAQVIEWAKDNGYGLAAEWMEHTQNFLESRHI
jgi:hypothetical protein